MGQRISSSLSPQRQLPDGSFRVIDFETAATNETVRYSCTYDLLADRAIHTPDGVCMKYRRRENDGELTKDIVDITYSEALHNSNSCGVWLDANCRPTPLRKGDLGLEGLATSVTSDSTRLNFKAVGILASNCAEWVQIYYGANAVGVTMCPLYETLGMEAVRSILMETQINVLVIEVNKLAILAATLAGSDDQVFIHNVDTVVLINPKRESLSGRNAELMAEIAATKTHRTGKSIKMVVFEELLSCVVDSKAATRLRLFDAAVCASLKCTPNCMDVNCMVSLPRCRLDGVDTLCYTSGTSGSPKAVVITNRMVSGVMCNSRFATHPAGSFPIKRGSVHLSYLPMAHVLERAVQLVYLASGATTAFYSGDITKVFEDAQLYKPQVFITVPRLLSRILDTVTAKVAKKPKALQALFHMAVDQKVKQRSGDANGKYTKPVTKPLSEIASSWIHCNFDQMELLDPSVRAENGYATLRDQLKSVSTSSDTPITYLEIEGGSICRTPIIDNIFFKETSQLLGGNVDSIICGGAPLDPDVAHKVEAILCVPIVQGFGMSETFGPCFLRRSEDPTAESVGHMWPSINFKLDPVEEMGYSAGSGKGELCLRGIGVSPGYFKRPDLTNEAIDSEGYFHTGDVAMIDEASRVTIIDRKKNIFKLAQGEYVAPDRIEAVYARCEHVSQIFVHGDGLQSYLVALVKPTESAFREYEGYTRRFSDGSTQTADFHSSNTMRSIASSKSIFTAKSVSTEATAPPCLTQTFEEWLLKQMRTVDDCLKGFEKVKRIRVLDEEMGIDNGMMTPTFKIVRKTVTERYGEDLKMLYA